MDQAEDDWAMDLLTVLCSARESQYPDPPQQIQAPSAPLKGGSDHFLGEGGR